MKTIFFPFDSIFLFQIFLDILKRFVCVADRYTYQTPVGIENPVTSVMHTAENPTPLSRTSGDGAETSKHIQTLLKIEAYLSKMLEYMNVKRSKDASESDVNNAINEWRELGLVIDRLVFIGSLVTFFLCSVTLLT